MKPFTDFLWKHKYLIISLIFAYFILAGCTRRVTTPDEGLFESFAFSMTNGKALYADIFDHKPPGIFWINCLWIRLFGPTETAISIGVILVCLVHVFAIWKIIYLVTKNEIWASIFSILFCLAQFRYDNFGSGNFTETYASFFVTIGVYFALLFFQKNVLKYIFWSGLFFAMAPMVKEPFALSGLGVAVYLFFRLIYKREWKPMLLFLLGFISICVVVYGFMYWQNLLEGYNESLAISNAYRKFVKTMNYIISSLKITWDWHLQRLALHSYVMITVLTIVIAVTAIKWRVYFLRIMFVLCFIDWLFVSIIQNNFSHYWLQIIPNLVVYFAIGLWFLLEFTKFKNPVIYVLGFAVIFCYFKLNREEFGFALNFTKRTHTKVESILKSEVNNAKRGEVTLVVLSKRLGAYYLKCGQVIPLRHGIPYDFHIFNLPTFPGRKRFEIDSAKLEIMKPKYLLTQNNELAPFYDGYGFQKWIDKYYVLYKEEPHPEGDRLTLYRLK